MISITYYGPPQKSGLALHLDANPRVLPADDIPIGGWLLLRGEAEDGLEGDVPIKASVVAEDELVEVGGDILRAQAVVGAEAPALQEGENPMNPSEGDMSCPTSCRADMPLEC